MNGRPSPSSLAWTTRLTILFILSANGGLNFLMADSFPLFGSGEGLGLFRFWLLLSFKFIHDDIEHPVKMLFAYFNVLN